MKYRLKYIGLATLFVGIMLLTALLLTQLTAFYGVLTSLSFYNYLLLVPVSLIVVGLAAYIGFLKWESRY